MDYQFEKLPPPFILLDHLYLQTLVKAKKIGLTGGEITTATVSSHMSRPPFWFYERERYSPIKSYPREQFFIPVDRAIHFFEKETQLKVPAFDCYKEGMEGYFRFEDSAFHTVAGTNPLQIVVGQHYLLPKSHFIDRALYVGVSSNPYESPRLVRAGRDHDESSVLAGGFDIRHLTTEQVYCIVNKNLAAQQQEIQSERDQDARPKVVG